MLTKINPYDIVCAHVATFRRFDTQKFSYGEACFHLLAPALVALIYVWRFTAVSESVISIVVSAASIVAGLLLNLLVLIYTLAYNSRDRKSSRANYDSFIALTRECFATIAYSVFLCVLLIAFSFVALADSIGVKLASNFIVLYCGTSALLCLLIILKRCYAMINYELS